MTIDFTPTPEQVQLRNMARSFAEKVLRPLATDLERVADPWECFARTRPAFVEMAKAGFTTAFIPEEFGGGGFGCIEFALAAEELTRVEVGVPTTLLANGLALQPVIQFGTPDQKERFLRPFTEAEGADRLACFAFTEASGGANFDSDDPDAGVVTYAQRDGDHYIISGVKHFATNWLGSRRRPSIYRASTYGSRRRRQGGFERNCCAGRDTRDTSRQNRRQDGASTYGPA